jgi:1,2-diacylglycerol 3-alpha-glucosyltransferase
MSDSGLKMRIRVAVIWIDWYPYHVARFRGLWTALGGQAAGIELVGGIGVHTGLKFREELPRDLPIETLLPETGWRDANQYRLAYMLWHRLSELNPEAVLVPGYYTLPAIAAAVWARIHGVPSILMTESTAYDHLRVGWKEWLKARVIGTLFTWAVTGGRDHVAYLEQLGFPAERIVSYYDVVDNDLFRDGTAALRSDPTLTPSAFSLPESPFFLYVGRLAAEKNVCTLLAGWLAYRKDGGTWPLVLVGDGPEAASLRVLAQATPYVDDIYFPGLKSSRELLPYYAFAGCFVLPSTREPWGLVVNEAMASALPVLVSSHCGCAADLVNQDVNGFVFEPMDTQTIAMELRRMERMPSVKRLAMGRASSDMIQSFSPQRFGLSIASIAKSPGCSGSLQALPGGSQ